MPPSNRSDDTPLDRSGDDERGMPSHRVGSVPNQPKTPHHSFRVDDDLWEAAKARAAERGETVAEVLRAFLREYVEREEDASSE